MAEEHGERVRQGVSGGYLDCKRRISAQESRIVVDLGVVVALSPQLLLEDVQDGLLLLVQMSREARELVLHSAVTGAQSAKGLSNTRVGVHENVRTASTAAETYLCRCGRRHD